MSRTYIKGFDGIRAVAVMMVMVHHKLWAVVPDSLSLGQTGVSLFFCLSGCLIVGILRDARARCESGSSQVGQELKNFYVRRVLRLSPAYFFYVTVALALVLLWPDKFDYSGFAFHFTYTTNFWVGFVEKSWSNIFGHFWSLAVEEQYYLVAAPALLLVGMAYARQVMVAFVVVGILTFAVLYLAGASWITIYTFPTVNFVIISLGGLLAIYRPVFGAASMAVGLVLLAAASSSVAAEYIAQVCMVPAGAVVLLLLAGGCTLVVGFVFSNQSHPVISALEAAPLRWIGKVSYGIYIYHIVVPFRSVGGTAIPSLWGGGYNYALGYALGTVLYFGLTFFVAFVSWHLLERPFLGLKKNFEAARSPKGAAAGLEAYSQRLR